MIQISNNKTNTQNTTTIITITINDNDDPLIFLSNNIPAIILSLIFFCIIAKCCINNIDKIKKSKCYKNIFKHTIPKTRTFSSFEFLENQQQYVISAPTNQEIPQVEAIQIFEAQVCNLHEPQRVILLDQLERGTRAQI